MLRIPRRKYRNTPTALGGLKFASKAEARRYGQLLLLERAGEISEITLQPKFTLDVNGLNVATYIGDFSYLQNQILVVEDVKSSATKTAVYRLKKKLMKAIHGIDLVEVEAASGK